MGGHPDDPECGCAGTSLQLIKKGHDVTLIYLTNGNEGIGGKSHQEAAAVHRKESIAACKIPGDKHHQVASMLTIQAWMETQRPFTLYFYEMCTGMQALACHKSQNIGVTAAEAFVRMNGRTMGQLII